MATRGSIAARRSTAIERIETVAAQLGERLKLEALTLTVVERDPELKQVKMLEALADYLEGVWAKVQSQPAGKSKPPTKADFSKIKDTDLEKLAEERGFELRKAGQQDEVVTALEQAFKAGAALSGMTLDELRAFGQTFGYTLPEDVTDQAEAARLIVEAKFGAFVKAFQADAGATFRIADMDFMRAINPTGSES